MITAPVEIPLHKAPPSIGRAKNGKTLWSVDKNGPWVEVEPAAKAYLERRGWQVEYSVTSIATRVISAALFTIFAGDKSAPRFFSLVSSGQSINRVEGIFGNKYGPTDKAAFATIYEAFRDRGIHVEGPLQFIKIVTFSSKKYTDMTANTRDLFFENVSKYLDEETITALRPLFEKWIIHYTRKLRKTDRKKGFRFGEPIDRDYTLLRLNTFIKSGEEIDFDGYKNNYNYYIMKTAISDYKRNFRKYEGVYDRISGSFNKIQMPESDQEIIESQDFKNSTSAFSLTYKCVDENQIIQFNTLIRNIGIDKILGIVMGDHEKWSKTQTWFSAGESDLFISKGDVSYFCEIKSPNDRVHQSQRDFMAYVPERCGIEYIIGKVKVL